ncbi:MAG TPA: cupin domain-containing protein [Gaiellaceae bacterium]|nr:cupin domain-containing protein [Gaiellaceae bacterium]
MAGVYNLADGPLHDEHDREGWRFRATRVADEIGAERIGGSVYELAEGERTFPYHYHHGVEEWLVVLGGTPTVRTPDGTRALQAGDVVCFASGAGGAHGVTGPGRFLMLSAGARPSIAVYPDSDKLGARPADDNDRLTFRRSSAVDYWDGEE